ncbi:MAG: hypothetical protein V8T45_07815 [Oscillospiraceae bacterium]
MKGIYTHFAVSDEEDEDSREYTLRQFRLLKALDVISAIEERGDIFSFSPCATAPTAVRW